MEYSPFDAFLPLVSDEPHHPFFSQALSPCPLHDIAMIFLQIFILASISCFIFCEVAKFTCTGLRTEYRK